MICPTKERKILQAIVKTCNTTNHKIIFGTDWGGNSLMILAGGNHVHCGSPEGTYEQLIDDLYNVLVKGYGLSWEKG